MGKALASPVGLHPATDSPASRCQRQSGENLARGRLGTGLRVEPFSPSLRPPCLLRGCHWWPCRNFLVARLGVLCPIPVCLLTVEAARGAVVPSSPERMELGTGVGGISDRLQTAGGVVDLTSDPPLPRD